MTIWMLTIEDEHRDAGGATAIPCKNEDALWRVCIDYLTSIAEDRTGNGRIDSCISNMAQEALRHVKGDGEMSDEIRSAMDYFEHRMERHYDDNREYGGRFYWSHYECTVRE